MARSRQRLFKLLFVFAVCALLAFLLFQRVLVQTTSQNGSRFNNVDKKLEDRQNCRLNQCFHVAVWDRKVCSMTFVNVLHFPKFPVYPDRTYSTNSWSLAVREIDKPCIKRIQTRLRPIESGFYKFRVRSSLGLRVSLETNYRSGEVSSILESPGRQNDEAVFSKAYLLRSHKSYYFEMVLFCLPGESDLTVEWLLPGATQFQHVQSREFTCDIPVVPPRHPLVPGSRVLPPDKHHLLSFIPRIHLIQSFPPCSANKRTWNNLTQETIVYTPPGQPPPDIEDAVRAVMAALEKAIPRKYPSFEITKVESTRHSTPRQPRRLLVDLEFSVDGLDYKQRMSEYFLGYYHGNNFTLCTPTRYGWNRLQTLNFVFLADLYQNQTVWVDYFIKNMAELLTSSLDVNFKVIVTTRDERQARSYDSRLRGSGFDRYSVVLLGRATSESRAFRAALSMVEEDDSIVVLCAARLYMPTMIFEEIRKHTFQGTMAYSPIPFQLNCGYFPGSGPVKGNWCSPCGGVVALHKQDWKIILESNSEMLSSDKPRGYSFFQDKENLFRLISNAGIELIQVNLNGLYRL